MRHECRCLKPHRPTLARLAGVATHLKLFVLKLFDILELMDGEHFDIPTAILEVLQVLGVLCVRESVRSELEVPPLVLARLRIVETKTVQAPMRSGARTTLQGTRLLTKKLRLSSFFFFSRKPSIMIADILLQKKLATSSAFPHCSTIPLY